ncbi:hypothetical protein Rrhod_2695 [Rhodococcus rhodnii LMG 5362]|uniref:Uncharacterized protein n=1 Tax=Rhodococcus rhodnii LMG 5362 TaxID=1273125 RepID=R7WKV3_9NOCA|nr:hypothetical protein Rrhod_2695 [Rhodococcus rhodnii LMG 5362]
MHIRAQPGFAGPDDPPSDPDSGRSPALPARPKREIRILGAAR